MTYKQALEWIEANKQLIGTETEKGMKIGELVAVPVDPKDKEAFIRSYIFNKNNGITVLPYTNGELEVWAIDTDRLKPNGMLLYKQMAV